MNVVSVFDAETISDVSKATNLADVIQAFYNHDYTVEVIKRGSGRVGLYVPEIGRFTLKVAFNNEGIRQNLKERDLWNSDPEIHNFVLTFYDCTDDGRIGLYAYYDPIQ